MGNFRIACIFFMLTFWYVCDSFHTQSHRGVRRSICRRAPPCCPGHVCRAYQRFDASAPVAACARSREGRPMYAPGSRAQRRFCGGRGSVQDIRSSRFAGRGLSVGGPSQAFGRRVPGGQPRSLMGRSAGGQRMGPPGQMRSLRWGGSQRSAPQWDQSVLGQGLSGIPQQRMMGQRTPMRISGPIGGISQQRMLGQGPSMGVSGSDFTGTGSSLQGPPISFGAVPSFGSQLSQSGFRQPTTELRSPQLPGGRLNTFAQVPTGQQQFVQGQQSRGQGQQMFGQGQDAFSSGITSFDQQHLSLPGQGQSGQTAVSSQSLFSQGQPDVFSQGQPDVFSQGQPDFTQFIDQSQLGGQSFGQLPNILSPPGGLPQARLVEQPGVQVEPIGGTEQMTGGEGQTAVTQQQGGQSQVKP